ncbi:MAG: M42 family metallopeptidase [Clostridiales bacterium]|nr:M42 family metallopeptidase [Clostridiales bacterium]
MLKLLKELCLASGISGYEDEIRKIIADKCRPYADEMKVDNMGNLFVYKKGAKKSRKKLMIAAHMDEVGFIVNAIEEEGYLRFETVGGIDPKVVLGRKVLVGDAKVPGVIGLKAYHLVSAAEEKVVPKIYDMYIDIGAPDKDSAEKLVKIGDPIVFDSDFVRFGKGNNKVKVKAMDDRLGCAMMVKLIESDLPMDIHFVFTVQEEVGLRGAEVAAFALEPDIALVLEGTTSADIPGVEDSKKISVIGKGPVIGCVDRGTIYDQGLFDALKGLADGAAIPWQIKNVIAGGTDAASIQRSREGVRVANISTPVRYLHSASTVADTGDIEKAFKLVKLFIDALAAGKVK